MLLSRLSALAAALSLVAGLKVEESDDGTEYTVYVENDDDFTVTIGESGSLSSILYRGTEYQSSETGSHIASGLGGVTMDYYVDGDIAVVTAVADSDDFDLTHYYIFKADESNIYMGTYTVSTPSVGELRWIARLVELDQGFKEGDVSETANGDAIEAEDVFLVGDETRSKFYSSQRFIDDDVYCCYDEGATVHACFLSSTRSREKSSGGPFFRDIDLQQGGDYTSMTFYMYSGHVQTEEARQGFHGPYILSFSGSGIPNWDDYDTSFFDDLDLEGYVADSGRGYVSGAVDGVSDGFAAVVHWYNDDYQTWVNVSSDGTYTSQGIVPGDYTVVLYQGEFKATETTVTVAAGETASVDLSADSDALTEDRTTIFQLGEYDGTPTGFLNADLQLRMHPSDARMSSWDVSEFAADDDISGFPMAMFMDYNNGINITFTVDAVPSSEVKARVATTLSNGGGRPIIGLNGNDCDDPGAPTTIDSRGVTRGAYHGQMEQFSCTWDEGTLVEGDNALSISVLSGSSGDEFLSPMVIFDAIEVYYV